MENSFLSSNNFQNKQKQERNKIMFIKNYILAGFISLVLIILLGACTLPKEEEKVEDNEVDVLENQATGDLRADTSDWESFQNDVFSFNFPNDWQVVEISDNQILVQSTDKKIELGGVGPDDYYIFENQAIKVNVEKYADNYCAIAITLDQGFGDSTWDQYFESKYEGIVVSYENAGLSSIIDNEAIVATEVEGVYSGSPRVFVRQGDNVYQIALYNSGKMKQDQANAIFNSFLAEFDF